MNARFAALSFTAIVFSFASGASAQWQPHGFGVCTANFTQFGPVTCSDGAGGVIVAWSDNRFGASDIYAQRLDSNGVPQWTIDGVLVCAAAEGQTSPVIVADGAGGAVIAWQDRRFGNANTDVYAQGLNATGVTMWAQDGMAICNAVGHQHVSDIAWSGSAAVIVWYDYRFNFDAADIYAQRVDSFGSVMWSGDGVAVADPANHQVAPRVTSDGVGGAIVAWTDFRSGVQYDVYAQRLDNNGTGLWNFNGVALCTAANSKFNLEMIADGAGGAIAVWQDYRDVNFNEGIYAARVDNAGVTMWPFDGVALCTSSGVQDLPAIASDGAGGAIVAWHDSRSGVGINIYAQRVFSSGVTAWATDGVAMSTVAASQTNPVVVPDGAGGAIVAWEDYRSTKADIYAQRVDVTGTPQWAVGGNVVSGAASDQWRPSMISDGAGGAIAAWIDERYGPHPDIFAQRIPADGSIPTPVERTPTASLLKLSPNFPNPFSQETSMALDISADANASIDVYDVTGHQVRGIETVRVIAGSNRVTFNGRDQTGRPLPNGVYFYRVRAGGETVTKKMVIAR